MINAEKEKAKSLVQSGNRGGWYRRPKTMVCFGPGVPCGGGKHLCKQNKKKNCLHSPCAISSASPAAEGQETGSVD